MVEAEFTPHCSDGDFHRKMADRGVDGVSGKKTVESMALSPMVRIGNKLTRTQ